MQVKILKESAKPEVDGRSQSKGIAFAEFVDHEHALCALRQLNNNPAPFGKNTAECLAEGYESRHNRFLQLTNVACCLQARKGGRSLSLLWRMPSL